MIGNIHLGNSLAATVSAITRAWNDDLLPLLRANTISAGRGISVDKHPSGTIITCTAAGHGGAAPAATEYKGYFKLVDASTYTSGALTTARVKVVDGSNESGAVCGYCDLSGCSAVGTATVSIGGTSAAINLYGWYTSGGYSAAIGTSAPFSGNVGVYQLGHVEVSSGAVTIVQDWQGGVAYFSLRYVV